MGFWNFTEEFDKQIKKIDFDVQGISLRHTGIARSANCQGKFTNIIQAFLI